MAKKILIIEDEDLISKVLSIRLETMGHSVFTAGDGAEGLELVKKHRPDLAIIDIGLPKIDGTTLCGLIKGDPELRRTKVLMLTGKHLVGDMENAFQAGADLYVSKPYEWPRLQLQVEKLLQ